MGSISTLFRTNPRTKKLFSLNLRYMTRLSRRAAFLKDLEHVLRLLMLFDDDTTDDFDEIIELYCL